MSEILYIVPIIKDKIIFLTCDFISISKNHSILNDFSHKFIYLFKMWIKIGNIIFITLEIDFNEPWIKFMLIKSLTTNFKYDNEPCWVMALLMVGFVEICDFTLSCRPPALSLGQARPSRHLWYAYLNMSFLLEVTWH